LRRTIWALHVGRVVSSAGIAATSTLRRASNALPSRLVADAGRVAIGTSEPLLGAAVAVERHDLGTGFRIRESTDIARVGPTVVIIVVAFVTRTAATDHDPNDH
jgi:hypothetical protein